MYLNLLLQVEYYFRGIHQSSCQFIEAEDVCSYTVYCFRTELRVVGAIRSSKSAPSQPASLRYVYYPPMVAQVSLVLSYLQISGLKCSICIAHFPMYATYSAHLIILYFIAVISDLVRNTNYYAIPHSVFSIPIFLLSLPPSQINIFLALRSLTLSTHVLPSG